MAFWDDIWLNEGFANWMGHKITVQFEPAWHDESRELDERLEALARRLARHRAPRARADQDAPTTSRTCSTASPTKRARRSSTCSRRYVGADKFRAGVRDYLTTPRVRQRDVDGLHRAPSASRRARTSRRRCRTVPRSGWRARDRHQRRSAAKASRRSRSRNIATSSPARRSRRRRSRGSFPSASRTSKAASAPRPARSSSAPTGTLELAGKCPRWILGNVGGRGYYRTFYSTKARDRAA